MRYRRLIIGVDVKKTISWNDVKCSLKATPGVLAVWLENEEIKEIKDNEVRENEKISC